MGLTRAGCHHVRNVALWEDLAQKYGRAVHPTTDELIAAQGLTFPGDPHDLIGDFWPEGESVDDFLRKGITLGGLRIRDLIDEGRKD